MTVEIVILFAIILVLILIFVFEIWPADTTSVMLMVVLMVGGFVSPEEGVSGLSNQATVTVLALMVLSVGLESSGVIARMGRAMEGVLKSAEWLAVLALMLIAGMFSAFTSTTAVVIVFLRIVLKMSQKIPNSISRLLIPLSFAGIMGGACTLFGTSTNLLISAIATDYGIAPLGVFEFTPIGAIFFVAGVAFMVIIGRHLIPKRQQKNSGDQKYVIQEYLAEVVIPAQSPLIGTKVIEASVFQDTDIQLFKIKRRRQKPHFPTSLELLQAGDILIVKGDVENIAQLRLRDDLRLLPREVLEDRDTKAMTLCEVIVRPGSRLLGKSLTSSSVKRNFNAIPLAVKKNAQSFFYGLSELKIDSGDSVLMEVDRSSFQRFYNSSEFVVLEEHEDLAPRAQKMWIAAFIMLAVIVMAVLQILPILVSSLVGCVAMFLTGCLDLQKAYRRIDWSVFFLLAGVIPLGIAMDNTGASELISATFVEAFGELSPRPLIAVLFIFTALLSAIISNNATAILIAPIAVSIAGALQLDPRPLLITVMFAANTSYLSPVGYQTNTLIYGPGGYKFVDFFKVGGLLTLLIWALASWLIPWFYF